MAGYVYVDTQAIKASEWKLEIGSYEGEVTAEEFAARHNLIALNDNSDEASLTYVFIGERKNVIEAFDDYSINIS